MTLYSKDLIDEHGVTEGDPSLPVSGVEPSPVTEGYVIPEEKKQESPEDDVMKMIRETAERQKQMRIEQNILKTKGVNPDEHAEAVEISDKKKIPADAVRARMGEYREDARQEKIRLQLERMKDRPLTVELMSDPDKMKLTWDDIPVTQRIEGFFVDTPETGSAYWKRGIRDPLIAFAGKGTVMFGDALVGIVDFAAGSIRDAHYLGQKQLEAMHGEEFAPKEKPSDVTVKKLLKEYIGLDAKETQETFHKWLTPETQWAMEDVEKAEGLFGTLEAYMNNPAALSQDAISSWPYLLASMAAAKKAFVMGASKTQAMIIAHLVEGGLTAGAMNSALQDQGVDPQTARSHSSAAGMMTAVIGFVAGRLGFGDAVESALLPSSPIKIIQNQAVKATLKESMKRYAIEGGKGFVQEGLLEEGFQNVSEKIFENLAEGKDPFEDLGKAYGQGVAVGGLMGTTMNVMNTYASNVMAIDRAKKSQELMEALGDDVKASKLRERSGPIWKDFIDKATRNGEVTNVYITRDKMEEYFQANDVDIETLAEEVPEINEWLTEARERNADVAIPIADYVNHIAPTDMHEALILDTKFNPVDLTPRESIEMEQNLPDLVQEMVEMEQSKLESQINDQDSYDYILDSMTDKMVQSGNSPTIAAQQAPILAAAYDAIAQTYGKDARNLYDQYGIETRYPIPKNLTSTTSIDSFINDVRKGTAEINDSETLIDYLDSKGVDIATANNKQVKDAMKQGAMEAEEDAAIQEYNQYDDYTVNVEATETETGKLVTLEQNAGEAIEEVDSQVEQLQELIQCVRA